MSTFICPVCGYEHCVNKMELWGVYEYDGKETEIDCQGCGKPLVVESKVVDWSFEAEIKD